MKSKLFFRKMYIYHTLLVLPPLHTKTTKEKTEEFKQELSIFAESFNMHGPGAVGDDLEKGTCPPEPCL